MQPYCSAFNEATANWAWPHWRHSRLPTTWIVRRATDFEGRVALTGVNNSGIALNFGYEFSVEVLKGASVRSEGWRVAKESKAANKKKIGVVRFRILDLDQPTRELWEFLATAIKRLTNCYWRSWLTIHSAIGNAKRTQQYLADLTAYYKGQYPGLKPLCDVDPLSPEVHRKVLAEIKSQYPMLNNRCIELAMQLLGKDVIKKKSSKGNMPRWIRILADDGEFPNSSSPLPVPFDKRNSGIIAPMSDDEDFQLYLHLDRIERPGKKYAGSTKQVVRLKTRGEKQSPILWKIAQGEYEFAHSSLVYKESKDRWFAHICYRMPKVAKQKLDQRRVAFLRPAKKQPWWLRIDSYHHFMGGREGRHVAYAREQLLTSRWCRQESYRHASAARKGHGRDRAVGRVHLLKNRWHDFVKTTNRQLVHDVIAKCLETNCGRLVYFQPVGPIRNNRFLHNAGKVPGRMDNSSWDWYQVQRLLARKCDEVGIDFKVCKVGERKYRTLESRVA